jgi:hypothetical protein
MRGSGAKLSSFCYFITGETLFLSKKETAVVENLLGRG